MRDRLGRWLHASGTDPAVLVTVSARVVQALGWLLVIPLVATHLTEEEQGFHVTFLSFATMQVLLELGLTTVLVQLVAHEAGLCAFPSEGGITGPLEARQRLASVVRLGVRLLIGLSLALLLVLLPAGWIFFSHQNTTGVAWHEPWTIFALAVALQAGLTGLVAMVEGSGAILTAAWIRLLVALCGLGTLAIVLLANGRLYAIALMVTIQVLVAIALLGRWGGARLRAALSCPDRSLASWRHEVLPFQLPIAISWASGFFIFQIITPLIFSHHGPIEAGRYGLSMQVASGIAAVAMSWITTKQATWGAAVARQDWIMLDQSFSRTWRMAMLVAMCAATGVVVALMMVHHQGWAIGARFSALPVMVLVCLTAVITVPINAQAAYLRAHKRDPFVITSVIMAVLMTSGYLLVISFGTQAVALVGLGVTILVGLGGGSFIFLRCRQRWHLRNPEGPVLVHAH